MGEDGQTIFQRISNLFMLLLLGMGLSLNNSLAVFEAAVGKQSPFLRTPKLNLLGKSSPKKFSAYLLPRDPFAWIEILLGVYTTGLLFYVLRQGVWSLVIWLVLYASGYTIIGSLNFKQSWRIRR
jgi:hypothetical protein